MLIFLIVLAPSPFIKNNPAHTSATPVPTEVKQVETKKSEAPTGPVSAAKTIEQVDNAANAKKPAQTSCEAEIAKYDWPQNVATAIAKAESRLRPDARGDITLTYMQNGVRYGDSWGCFQVRYLPGRPTPDQLVKPEVNVAHAYKLYKASSWYPWSVWNNGQYKKYL